MMNLVAMLLRQVWAWGTFPHAMLVFLSLWAVHVQMTYRVPGRLLFLMLPWIGVALSCLSLLIFINRLTLRLREGSFGAMLGRTERHALLVSLALIIVSFLVPAWLAKDWLLPLYLWGTLGVAWVALAAFVTRLTARAPADSAWNVFQQMERVALLLVGGFVLYSFVLFLNGKLDTSLPVEHNSEILDIRGGEVEIGWLLPYSWADVRSWRRPSRIEQVFLAPHERSRAWPGQAVLIKIQTGALGIPWVASLVRDEEKHYQQVLRIAPTATGPRKNLIDFYLDRRRWKEAAVAAREYHELYPNDYDFTVGVAAALGVARQHHEAVALFEPFLGRGPNYELLNMLGWSLHLGGESPRGIALLESSIPLEPDNWWAYYHLGYAYRDVGRLHDAVVMFQKVLERRPNYPEIEEQLQLLRQRMTQPAAPPGR